MIIAVKTEFFGLDSNGNRVTIAHFVGDSSADLPSLSAYTSGGVQITVGSTFHSVIDGADYEMTSVGAWVLSQPGQAAYTKTEVDALLSDRMPMKNADYTPLVTSGTWDLFTLPVGVYYRTTSISDVSNIPSGLNVAFFAIVQNTIGSNRRQITLYPCTQATVGEFYRCLETGSGYGSWCKFSGTAV